MFLVARSWLLVLVADSESNEGLLRSVREKGGGGDNNKLGLSRRKGILVKWSFECLLDTNTNVIHSLVMLVSRPTTGRTSVSD